MQTATADPLVGRTLEGRYRIVDRIARGGMSTVYSAVDERLDRQVAVKVMSSALSADPAFSDRFTREARVAARLTHLNAVAVYDQGTDVDPSGTHVFLVMELVVGRTLRALLRERGRLTPAEAVSIIEPVLSALSAAHHAGLAHRDIKPENILLSDDGVVKVADFGLARAVESNDSATRTGLMMGTVAYCAPEQVSKGRADQRSDVYSAGIVLFELLTGKPPYQGESAMTVAYQHVHSRVPAPSTIVPGIPRQLDELVVSATDSDPAGRPLDAGAFLALVTDARTDLDLPVVPIPPRPRPANRPPNAGRRSAIPSARTGDTTDVLRGGGPFDTAIGPELGLARGDLVEPPPPVVIPPGRRPVSARTRRRRRALITLLILLLLGALAVYGGWWLAAGRYAHVPNVRGETSNAAIKDLRSAGYKVGSNINHQFSETVQAGLVIGTDPSPGARLIRGKTVSLIVSRGQERFTVPTVFGMSQSDALQALKQIPVQPQVVQASNDKVPKGEALGTSPRSGTKVKRDQVVKLVISSGPPVVAVPPIEPGTPLHKAKTELEAAGFQTFVAEEFSDTIDRGHVIRVTPSDNAVKGQTITVVVSKGPARVTIPDIGSFPKLKDAQAKLEALGLKVQIVPSPYGGPGNRVLTMDPPAGSVVDAGSTVTLTVF